jgi:RNA polymerase sigma-70 factor (ECF subfamily)
MTEATDCQLLERFVRQRDEAAFTTLARRHAALVLGVCKRVLGDEHDAEDVFQATFLVLARKAVALPWQPSVGPWLSAVAQRLALHARATRRRCREQLAGTLLGTRDDALMLPAPSTDPAMEVAAQEVRRLVREELARLPEKYRAPATLCYLEGKTNEQAAHELGWPTGSMSRRLEKARRLLRQRLLGRGLALLTLLLALVLAPLWWLHPASRSGNSLLCGTEVGNTDTETLLRRLAEEQQPALDHPQVAGLAESALGLAARLERHDPRRLPEDWKRQVRDMHVSAGQFAAAVDAGDRPTTRRAAARLYAACNSCHQTFRDY